MILGMPKPFWNHAHPCKIIVRFDPLLVYVPSQINDRVTGPGPLATVGEI